MQSSAPVGDSGLSELEAKRQAVLASMKRKKAVLRASNSPDPQVNNALGVRNVDVDDEDKLGRALLDAVKDLRSLGFSFDDIVERSGVRREFLADCYTTWKFVVPKIESAPSSESEPEQAPVFVPKWHDQRSHSNSPIVHQRPLFNNKYNRLQVEEKPEWLKDLVIDLSETSDEEESESESQGEQDKTEFPNDVAQEKEEIVPTPTTEIENSNEKKRKLEVDEDFASQKKLLKKNIEDLSNRIKHNESKGASVYKNWQSLQKELKEKEAQLTWLKKQVSIMESDITTTKGIIKQGDENSNSISEWKSELASKLIQLEELENEEQKQIKIEKKRSSLKAKLQQQMKIKKQREVQEKEEKKRKNEEMEEGIESASLDAEDTNNIDRDILNMTSNGMVSADTIHKIPKHQATHFTPYNSLGFKKQNTISVSDNDQLCPIELTQGKCTDKTCKFQHLSSN